MTHIATAAQEHTTWLCTDGKKGARLVAKGLESLADCQIGDHDLSRADFTRADCRRTNFAKSCLTGVDFTGADLSFANLSSARGLSAGDLKGSNLTGAFLPSHLNDFNLLVRADESAKSIRSTLVWLLGIVTFVFLSVVGLNDFQLVTESGGWVLPILQTQVSSSTLFVLVPVALLLLHLYVLTQMQAWSHSVGLLPWRFTDGLYLDERLYPWIGVGLVTTLVTGLSGRKTGTAVVQLLILCALLGLLVPACVGFLFSKFLVMQDWVTDNAFFNGVSVLVVCGALSAAGSAYYGLKIRNGLRGLYDEKTRRIPVLGSPIGAFLSACAMFIITLTVAVPVAYGPVARDLDGSEDYGGSQCHGQPGEWIQVIAPLADLTHFAWAHARLSLRSHLPSFGADEEGYEGIVLTDRRLRYLDGSRRVAAGSDFSRSCLERANFEGANLSGSVFEDSELVEANLSNADLSGAKMRGANLTAAVLDGSKVLNADMSRSILRGVDLTEVQSNSSIQTINFVGADFSGANVPDDLAEAQLTQATFESMNLEEVVFDQSILHDASFSGSNLCHGSFVNAKMEKVDLENTNSVGVKFEGAQLADALFGEANVTGASFKNADLTNVDMRQIELHDSRSDECPGRVARATTFEGANLSWARLEGLDLSGVRGLTRDQLDAACLDHTTILPHRLEEGPPKGRAREHCRALSVEAIGDAG